MSEKPQIAWCDASESSRSAVLHLLFPAVMVWAASVLIYLLAVILSLLLVHLDRIPMETVQSPSLTRSGGNRKRQLGPLARDSARSSVANSASSISARAM